MAKESIKADLTFTIRLKELKLIVSGQKVEEYRASKEYYYKKFGELDPITCEPKKEIKTIKLHCPYKDNAPYCIIKVSKIRHEQFNNSIPENFDKGDIAFTIYIEKIIEHNLSN